MGEDAFELVFHATPWLDSFVGGTLTASGSSPGETGS